LGDIYISSQFSTFVISGTFRSKGGKILVQKRSWEMLRLFTDHIAYPIFGMHETPQDDTLEYALPQNTDVVPLPVVWRVGKVFNTLLNRGLTKETQAVIDDCYAVYLRQPLWICYDIFKYALKRKKKIIASYHGDWVDSYRQRETTLVKHYFLTAFSFYINHILKTIARHSEVLFCVGESLAEKYGHLAPEKVVFANFLHSADDIAVPRRLCSQPPYKVLFVGGLEERKGIKYLIKAMAVLQRKGLGVHLTIVGAGSLKDKLILLADSEGIIQNVKFREYIQYGKELMEIYRCADIFVLPSISAEGVPKVLMEAMSQGIPVISTDIGSSRYLLEDGKYGITIQPKDSAAIASAVKRLIEDEKLRTKFVNNGLELARLSTREKQKKIIRSGLMDSIPEIVGTPQYLKYIPV